MTSLTLISLLVCADYPRTDLLVEPRVLVTKVPTTDWILLDARDKKAYKSNHIPGAIWVNHADWANYFGQEKNPRNWSIEIGALGILMDSKIIIYDDNHSKDAARIWWILKYWGVKDVRLLNGGWKGWITQMGPLEIPMKEPHPKEFLGQIQKDRFFDKQSILNSLNGKPIQIIDARSEKEHCGLDPLTNARAGSIPGSKHLNWGDLVHPETQRFRDAGQLRELFDWAGIDLETPSVTHCQSGGRASVMAFGMELMGAPKVANYYLGWSEWGNEKDLPIEKPAPRGKPSTKSGPATKGKP